MKSAAFAVLGVALVVGPLVFGHPIRDLRNWRNAGNWEPVQARVTEVSERRVLRDGRRHTEVDVRYTFSHQGKQREEGYHVKDAAFHKVPRKGDELTIRINPRDPSEALLNPQTELPLRALGMFVMVGFGIYFLFMVITGRADDIPVRFGSGEREDK
jgi:hypothetical protein